jgi:Ser/Thr protein kinase RdoA (MazF antagonist)
LGIIDFDMCGLGYYLFDLSAFRSNLRRTLPAARWGSAWGAFLRGYEGVRPLPQHIRAYLDRYLVVFGAMRRVAMVNRRLELLGSDTTKPEARARSTHFLRKSPGWLRRRLK